MSRRPNTRHGAVAADHQSPPESPTSSQVPLTPDQPVGPRIKLRLTRNVAPPAPIAPDSSPAPSHTDGEYQMDDSAAHTREMAGRATRNRQSRPNYAEIPVDELPSPTEPARHLTHSANNPHRAPSSTTSSKYFTRGVTNPVPIHDGGIETRRRRASGASGESSRISGAATNGLSRAPPASVLAAAAAGPSGATRRSTRASLAGVEAAEDGPEDGYSRMPVDEPDDEDAQGEYEDDFPPPEPVPYTTRSGRATRKTVIQETPSEEDDFENTIAPEEPDLRRSSVQQPLVHLADDSEESDVPRRKAGRRVTNSINGSAANHFIEDDAPEEEDENGNPIRRRLRSRGARNHASTATTSTTRAAGHATSRHDTAQDRATRAASRNAKKRKDDDFVMDDDNSENSSAVNELQAEMLDLGDTTDDNAHEGRGARSRGANGGGGKNRRGGGRSRHDSEIEVEGSQPAERTLRKRKDVNYYVPPPDAVFDLRRTSLGGPGGGGGGDRGNSGYGATRRKAPGSSALPNNGWLADLSLGTGALNGGDVGGMMPDSDSEDDAPGFVKDLRSQAKADLANMALAQGGSGNKNDSSGAGAAGTAATVTAGAIGRYDPEAARADADPLGVDLNVTFDQVGGLDDQINQLKEMVALPLLYPELFQQFGITPPRGVLFHGPPGTGKTLLARALAASCSSQSTKIAFFMRKGADCLSKWVGEAERQLRLLFEEARNAQPSIIFFDEIDGLAPVRSAKQDQIHSSLVATLLALMDGMDGRGQVVVIGATNRPDNVDPALRRPGRFDREFYFPLPNKEARKKIISINTAKWNPPLEDEFLDELASLTKGYGGADLRALCTEAALNAMQRRYPQIYKTNDRLLLDPASIQVQARDFMASVRKIVPSSARSTASAAAPLPSHLVPLLDDTLQKAKRVLNDLLPPKHRMSILEDAEFEQDDNDGSFGREILERSFETLRVYRPRLLIHGQRHMGQRLLGSALLHHLEGYHVQSLDIGNLLGSSDGSVENILTRMFVEAKRHQPSVLYIPSVLEWSRVLPESAKATFAALIESLTPSEPVLILALHDGSIEDLAKEDDRVKSWFGYSGDHYVEIAPSTIEQRHTFFESLMQHIQRPPSLFPDAMPRKRRILEELPKAAPLPPKVPAPAVIAAQNARDEAVRDILILRLQGILTDLMKKYKKSVFSAADLKAAYEQKMRELADVVPEGAEKTTQEHGAQGENGAATQTPTTDSVVISQATDHDGDGVHVRSEHQPMPVVVEEAEIDLVAQTTADGQLQAQAMLQVDPRSAENGASAVENVDPISAANAERKQKREALWKPHFVDLELMQNKLVDKENGYLTTRAFEKDVERIHENTMRCGGDIGKSNAMVSECRLNIKDHFQDQQIRMDIERMAAREYARREAEREKHSAKSKSNQPSPIRHSARRHGQAPEFDMFALAEVQKKKRTRAASTEMGDNHHTDSGQPEPKRVRVEFSDIEMHNADDSVEEIVVNSAEVESLAHVSGPGTQAMTAPLAGEVLDGQLGQAATISLPDPADVNRATNFEVQDAAEASSVQVEAPRSPTPEPPAKSFVVPDLENLRHTLAERTADFTLEELEQLRAMALGMIWKRRSDWDRSELVQELMSATENFVARVRKEAGI
ncbi:hypothetical protein QFC22_000742 [Naganishia vaughanmartiniae]|uniref:Uncharacterized protein n=1 Tax=Naganishia vaughanmartiniae TaxID=1424756 RepID=A0ACC2XJY4_9TREE|nr:hypothetical protein QFC22_000742 [Naganishia vaughanmartiniae]